VLVLDVAQLLAEARDEQQAIVGPDSEHEHDQDPGRVRGHGGARLRQQVDEALGDRVGEEDDQQRREGDEHRAVDGAEQEEHEHHGREQKLRVDVAEHLLGVGVEPEVAGQEDPHAVALLARDPADLLAPVRRLVEVGRDREHRVGDRAVRGDEVRRRAGRERDRRRLGERDLVAGVLDPLRVVRDLLAVGAGQASLAPVDDQPVRGLPALELVVEDADHLGGLRAGRQEGLRVVARLVAELSAQRAERRRGRDPGDRHEPLRAAPGYE
jgi:hypothetical protein